MYLKSIYLYGFKSFVDEITIEFENCLSGIVGPNGCGKSNIIDAFKWCLGEQSPTALRVRTMSDLIFNGNEKRPFAGFAEVSLTFDNSSSTLPIKFNEVCVKRRVYRSGENEYFINNLDCKLKDIKDIFAGSGLSTEEYSVIEQGKVEYIFTAKPEERRKLFEQSAGIAKYRYQKEEALKKLQQTKENLERVTLIMNEIKSQMDSLHDIVKKARLYEKLEAELKNLEIAFYVQKIVQKKNELSNIDMVLKELNTELEKFNSKMAILEAEIKNIREDITNKRDALENLQSDLNSLKVKLTRLDEQKKSGEDKIKEDMRYYNLLTNKINVLKSKADILRNDLDYTEKEIATFDKIINQTKSQLDSKIDLLNSTRGEIEDLQGRINEINEQIISKANERAHLKNEMTQLEVKLDNSQKTTLRLQKEIVEKKRKYDELVSVLSEDLRKFEELKTFITTKNDELKQIDKIILDLQTQKDGIILELDGVKKRVTELEFILMSTPNRDYEDFIIQNFHGVYGPIRNLIKIIPGYEKKVSIALGEAMNYFVCDNLESAIDVVTYVKQKKLGIFGFVLLDRLPEVEYLVKQDDDLILLTSLVSTDKKFEKVIRYLLHRMNLDDDGNIVGDVIIKGGEGSDGFLIDVKNIKSELDDLELRKKEAGSKLVEVSNELQELMVKRNKLFDELKENQMNEKILNEKILKNEMEKKIVEDEIKLIESEIASLESFEDESSGRIDSYSVDISKLEELEKFLILDKKETEKRLTKNQTEYQKLLKEYNEFHADHITKTERYNTLVKEKERLEAEIDASKLELSNLNAELNGLVDRTNENKKRISEIDNEYANLEKEISVCEEKIKNEKLNLKNLYLQDESKEAELKELKETINSINQQKYDMEIKKKSIEIEYDNYVNSLISNYSISLEEAISNYNNIETSEEKINRIKRKLQSLGGADVHITEQYEMLENRYNFLVSQYEDLIKSELDLKSVISKIDDNIKENFEKTFKLVLQNFKEIFRELFGGGEARLVLSDETNLLETGIDVIVQPPGKKLQSITLLSGGEKALTAIALLFSFYKVKPSPVCMLDEVDASLDEANISRYSSLLKEFSKKSQFIVITHNRRAIEFMDVIYGITMEEDGVSKLITLRLKDKIA